MLPVFHEQLAAHLGIDDLRVGSHRVGSDSGPRVLAWWSAGVNPSFARAWAVGALYEEEWHGDGPGLGEVTARGFVADAEGAATAPLATDEVFDALGRLDPFRLTPPRRKAVKMVTERGVEETWAETVTKDGLGYGVRWETRAAGGHFWFSNPWTDWLHEFERVLFRFARRVVTGSGAGRFEEQLQCWLNYREPVRSA